MSSGKPEAVGSTRVSASSGMDVVDKRLVSPLRGNSKYIWILPGFTVNLDLKQNFTVAFCIFSAR